MTTLILLPWLRGLIIWLCFTATTLVPPAIIACDGHDQSNPAYDSVRELDIDYDTGLTCVTELQNSRTAGNHVLLGSYDEFVAAKTTTKDGDILRGAMGKGEFANPGAPLTPKQIELLKANQQAAQTSLENAKKGLSPRGRPLKPETIETQTRTATDRIAEIDRILESGVQAPKN